MVILADYINGMNGSYEIQPRRGNWLWAACLVLLLAWLALASGRNPLVRNTSLLVAGTLALSLPPGVALALLLTRTDLPGRRGLLLLLGLMPFVPLYLQAAGWLAGFGVQGWHTYLALTPPWIEGWRGALWIHALAAIPWVTLMVSAGLLFVEGELEESALLDTSPWGVMWHVTLPRSAGAVAVGGLWIIIVAAGEMTITDLFQIRTYAEEVYTELSLGASVYELATYWLPGVAMVTCLAIAGAALCARITPAFRWPDWRGRVLFPLGIWRWPLAVLVALCLLVMMGVPLANLAYKAGVITVATSDGLERSWSIAKCLRVIATSPWNYSREFRWSLVIGGLSATIATAAGVLIAWAARRRGAVAIAVLLAMAALLALPGPLLGLSIIWLLNRPELPWLSDLYDYSILAPLLALTLRALPLTVLVLWHALRSVPEETLEAALLDGAGWWQRLLWIALPQRRLVLLAAWLVAFALSLGDLAASILVVPPGVMTLSIQVFTKLHYGQEDDVAGICLALVGLFAVLGALIFRVATRARRS